MADFDIEKAKAGEAIRARLTPNCCWVDVHFVGLSVANAPVVEHLDANGWSHLAVMRTTDLRMKPEPPREMWVQLYRDKVGVLCSQPYFKPEHANSSVRAGMVRVGGPQKVLVPDEN